MTHARTPFQVSRLDLWIDAAFDRRFAAEQDIVLKVAAAHGAADETWRTLQEADVYHVTAAKDELPPQWFVGEPLLQRCPRLLCVSSGGAGYDTVDVAACTRAGVLVVNQAGANAVSVAEHAFGLMLAVTRRIVESHVRLRGERGFTREDLMGSQLSGKTLGLVGLGAIGTQTARIARGFGMPVLAYDPYLEPDQAAERGARLCALDELLAQSDVVSLHCPLTPETRGMFGRERLRAMKRGALFVSTARGGIHDEVALYEALRDGALGGAGLDVWTVEPPAQDAPLLSLPQVVATYHTAGVTHEARRNVAAMGAEQIVALLRGQRPSRIVNPDAYEFFRRRYAARIGAS
ncbi:hydroxyacid dehydrogenase [Bordetella flabilis]|uniref:3-phosphoglycerate dehydrogenase n=1 Tax=Bordetella flabilis TaxID=463014 RepID=A0A193G9F8_9BORD|nr:hydroxyacid dehydrogenase [Bordetella flabilis]ANN75899.1 3-phosphoglycerate dehydrogenase [Bordetella flabilis]